jgi:hypothetical protein
VRAGLLAVGVRSEPEPVGVLGGSEHEVAHELDRSWNGRGVIAFEDVVGQPVQWVILHVVGADRVLDSEAVGIDEVDADRGAVSVIVLAAS